MMKTAPLEKCEKGGNWVNRQAVPFLLPFFDSFFDSALRENSSIPASSDPYAGTDFAEEP